MCKERTKTYVSDASGHSPLKKINELLTLRDALSEDKPIMQAQLEEKKVAIEELSEEKATMERDLEKKTETIETLSEEKATMEKELEKKSETIEKLSEENAIMEIELEEKTVALKDAKRAVAEAHWHFKAELAQNAAVLDEEKVRRKKWEDLSLSRSRTDKEWLEKTHHIYVRCLRKNHPEVIEEYKQIINEKRADFAHFAEVTKDLHPEIHETYTKLREMCDSMMAMSSPPPSPTSYSTETIKHSPLSDSLYTTCNNYWRLKFTLTSLSRCYTMCAC